LTNPVFVAEDLAIAGDLAGAVETPKAVCWITTVRPKATSEVASFVYELWDGLLAWLERLLPAISESWNGSLDVPLRVHLGLDDSEDWAGFSLKAGQGPPADAHLNLLPNSMAMELTIPFGFLAFFKRASNDGERNLLELIARGIRDLVEPSKRDSIPAVPSELVALCMRGAAARAIHLFQAADPTDYIAPVEKTKARYVPEEDRTPWELGLAWRARSRGDTHREEGVKQCTEFLNSLVHSLWRDIRQALERLERASVIGMALANIEGLIRERSWWRRTARAMDALYSSDTSVARVAGERESDRSLGIQTARILSEMALCTCPLAGRAVSTSDYDWLTAGIALLLVLAADSSAIHTGAAAPFVEVYDNGQIDTDHAFVSDIANPYLFATYSDRFQEAIASYDSLYLGRAQDRPASPLFGDSNLIEAFHAEFGLTPERLVDAVAELVDVATQGKDLLVRTTRTQLRTRLAEHRHFTEAECEALFRSFGLPHRARWDRTPPGFLARDWQPWRFRRRLSVVARPLLLLGEEDDTPVLYGLQQLAASTSYLFSSVELGWLPQEYCRSPEMRRFLGGVADSRGHAFTLEVQNALRESGWVTRAEVTVASLGGPSELGDFDVIAWHPVGNRMLAVECKRLQPAQSAHEIVDLLEEFRGEARDRLGRHLARCDWLRANLASVSQRLQAGTMGRKVVGTLVTNAEVPLSFKRDLPLPPETVMPIGRIAQTLVPT
jgi:hypothetical protein